MLKAPLCYTMNAYLVHCYIHLQYMIDQLLEMEGVFLQSPQVTFPWSHRSSKLKRDSRKR